MSLWVSWLHYPLIEAVYMAMLNGAKVRSQMQMWALTAVMQSMGRTCSSNSVSYSVHAWMILIDTWKVLVWFCMILESYHKNDFLFQNQPVRILLTISGIRASARNENLVGSDFMIRMASSKVLAGAFGIPWSGLEAVAYLYLLEHPLCFCPHCEGIYQTIENTSQSFNKDHMEASPINLRL